MEGYLIQEIHYRDIYGKRLWIEPMRFKRLYRIEADISHEGKEYRVKRVAVADRIQHVNIEERGK